MYQSATYVFASAPVSFLRARRAASGVLLLSCCLVSSANAQIAQPAAPAQSKPAPVTTTVIVHGETADDYLPESVTVGTLDDEPLQNAPLSASVVTRDLLTDQVSRLLTDVIQNDASVGSDYAPVGYYGSYQIRGFPIDLASGLAINGITIAGEQDVPLENKQSVEFVKGIAAVESGVASAGGLIGYVTKRPANIEAIDFATDHRGTTYGAVDLGHLFGTRKQVGARLNLAGERMVPYLNHTTGWRAMGAAAADWKMDAATTLKGDFEFQHKTERDGSGYQLLGGAVLPDINRLYRSTLLGDQAWSLPNTYDTFNAGARIDHDFNPSWTGFAAAGYSRSLIQDNVMYAYGAPVDADGDVACPGTAGAAEYYFCPDGSYAIYDYRNPDELRIDAQAEAMVTGHIRTGAITHGLTMGGVLFLRNVKMPEKSVYAYVGMENIYEPIAPVSMEDPIESAGPQVLYVDSRQRSAVIQDRMHLPGRIQLTAGGRYDSLRDHNFSASANTEKSVWLPQFSATFNPVENLTLYTNYGVQLSLGPQGPWWVANSSQYLAPFFTRQVEIGAKYAPGKRILLSTAFFHTRAPFFYPRVLAGADDVCPAGMAGDLCFESMGRETHNGMELSAQGKAARWLRLNGSATAMRATPDGTGTPAYDNKQVLNVPRVRTNVFADLTVPHVRGLHLMPGWNYTSRKQAARDNMVSVPGYNLFNMGARFTPGGDQGRLSFRVYADNIANKMYWSDTGSSYGDAYLWLGAPATVRLSAHYTF
jgi:iron complex outermembrane recepter protein